MNPVFFFFLLTGPDFIILLFNVSRLWVALTVTQLLLTVLLLRGSFLFRDGGLGKVYKKRAYDLNLFITKAVIKLFMLPPN